MPQPFRADPEWQAARDEYLADAEDENDSQALIRRMNAIYRLYDIEHAYTTGERNV